jgi:peptidoglycan/LPS O-acetylase OafA/YrhL
LSGDTLAKRFKDRFRALDGLRGAAALLVVFYHINLFNTGWPNHLTNNNFTTHGYLAVDLFFILSGLVISSNYLLRINSLLEARDFLILRFFRIYPLHFVILGVFVLFELIKMLAQDFFLTGPSHQSPFTGDRSIGGLAANLLLINGLHVSDVASWNGPSWSISCEFAAYLVFAFLVLTRATRNRLFFIAGTLVAVSLYLALALTRQTLDVTADWGIVRCLAGFYFGMLIFELRQTGHLSLPQRLAGPCEIVGAAGLILTMSFARGAFVAAVIPCCVVLIALLQSDRGPLAHLLKLRPAQFLGRISYSIYLAHGPIVLGFVIILNRLFFSFSIDKSLNPWIGDLLVVAAIASTLAVATATCTFIEEPGRLFGRSRFSHHRK